MFWCESLFISVQFLPYQLEIVRETANAYPEWGAIIPRDGKRVVQLVEFVGRVCFSLLKQIDY